MVRDAGLRRPDDALELADLEGLLREETDRPDPERVGESPEGGGRRSAPRAYITKSCFHDSNSEPADRRARPRFPAGQAFVGTESPAAAASASALSVLSHVNPARRRPKWP